MSMYRSQGASSRAYAIQEVSTRTPRKFDPPRDDKGRRQRISEFYGMNTFDLRQMKEKLPKEIYQKLISTIQSGKKLDLEIANPVAHAVKEWALARGVSHFCHWFQPQTGSTAEKHDAFMTPEADGSVIEKFSGAQLVQSEPDASSFPSGGMRTTFEARGYTAWDPSSPMFIMDGPSTKTLCIPSVFISYHGDALDEKTGLIRSIEVLSQKTCELLNLLGDKNVKRVVPTLGIEQEYFLIDRAFYMLRSDLVMSGRTLVGGQPPKGQQLEDHYFGSIPARVQAFMSEMEYELYKLGVPIKTRHNEVAPSQFETAPVFEEANIATDHNQLVMEVIKKVAIRHNFHALLHEKPFAGINGSGKHNNWSLMVTASGEELDGENLLEPGKTPSENLRFLTILASILRGVHKHSGLLRAAIASSGNDYRLGANEAPPAILSVFLGDLLTKILNSIESGAIEAQSTESALIKMGVSQLPEVMRDNTDRNRTSPFAFTGNKFEFRAVGSTASTAFPITILNAAVADGISEMLEALKKKGVTGKASDGKLIFEVIRDFAKASKAIRFEGNGYSDEWVKEAESRGLLNLRKTPEALAQIVTPQSLELLTKSKIFSKAEIHSRYHVRLERYIKNLQIEIDSLRNMVDTQVMPAGFSYYSFLAEGAKAAKDAGVPAPMGHAIAELHKLITQLQEARQSLEKAVGKSEIEVDEAKKAHLLAHEVSPAMMNVRGFCDQLESCVADDFWPLPKYREMLFIT